ncbi:polyprenyl synthetase family protein [Myxococcota bacterium]|nr:polyprenyl synthetase family protein [Myxococcota bacterium]
MTDELEEMRDRVEEALARYLDQWGGPEALRDAAAWSLLGPGKRLRPLLLLSTRRLFPGEGPDPLPAACALEMIHCYSLIHDDLPAMDDDDLRRGRPTCHRRHGEALAILAGDALLTEAFAWMGRAYRESPEIGIRVIAEMAAAAGAEGMVGGQVRDVLWTGRTLSREELELVHRGKTGALIRAAMRCGAILGGADAGMLDRLTRCGERLGMAFQVMDDVLDVTATPEELGKTPGKDRTQGKTTSVDLLGLQGSREFALALLEEVLEDLREMGERGEALSSLAVRMVRRSR